MAGSPRDASEGARTPARAPEGAGRAPRPSQADPASLGRARGVRPLGGQGPARLAPASPARRRVALACACACVLLVLVGAFFGFRALLGAANETRAQAGSAVTATDAYVALAVTDADGALAQAGLLYADSINNRALLAWVPADACADAASSADAGTFAEAYARGGSDALASALERSAQVDVVGVVGLTDDELASVRALVAGDSGAPTPAKLASELASGEAVTLSEAALRGLLATLRDVGDVGFVELSAPTQAQTGDEGSALVLRSSEWLSLVRGMRDPTA